jgi:hypothetical protein
MVKEEMVWLEKNNEEKTRNDMALDRLIEERRMGRICEKRVERLFSFSRSSSHCPSTQKRLRVLLTHIDLWT